MPKSKLLNCEKAFTISFGIFIIIGKSFHNFLCVFCRRVMQRAVEKHRYSVKFEPDTKVQKKGIPRLRGSEFNVPGRKSVHSSYQVDPLLIVVRKLSLKTLKRKAQEQGIL